MFENIKWLFFDVGSTLVDEHIAYEHRLKDIADMANTTYDNVYEMTMGFYKQNKKGDWETAKQLGVDMTKWHTEDEILYEDAVKCLETLSSRYKIGIIANQGLGTKERLEQHGILQYIDLVIASAEEGVAKPDRRMFEIALGRAKCLADQAVMIGDRIDYDIVPAKKMGMKTIWIKQGMGKYWNFSDESEKPNYEVNSLSDLLEVL